MDPSDETNSTPINMSEIKNIDTSHSHDVGNNNNENTTPSLDDQFKTNDNHYVPNNNGIATKMQDNDDAPSPLPPTELVKQTEIINSLHPSQNHNSTSKPLPSSHTPTKSIDEVKVNKAITFLRSNEIQNVTLDEKRKYLQTKVGLTTDEISMAFDKVAMDSMDRIANSEGLLVDDGTRSYGAPTNNNQQQPYQNNNNNGPHRRHPPPQQQYPTHNTQNMSPYNYNNMPSEYSDGRDHEGTPPSSFPTSTSLVGGFSLGIFCLAAIRWLNGGDFVLFPPPSTTTTTSLMGESNYTAEAVTKRDEGEGEARLLSINEGDTDESDSQGQEDEVEDDRYEDEDDEDGEYEEDEYDTNGDQEEDDGINMILNGTSDAASYHPTNNNNVLPQNNQQPSYEELVIEIRALTSAIHSYRDVQERANRAVHAHVGKGLTDDAMDFLRQKKSSTEVSNDKKVVPSLDEKSVSTVATMLMEVSNDLLQIKQSIAQDNVAKENSTGDESDNAMKVSNSEASESTEDAVDIEEGEPSKRIDMAMEKIQKLLAIVEKKVDESEKGDIEMKNGNDPTVDSSRNSHVAKEEEIETTKIVEESEVPATSSVQTDENSESSEPPQPQQVPSKSETEETGEQQQQKQLEDAIKTLGSSSNSVDDLKVGAQMLYLYCLNISKNPTVPRYRKIYTNNNTFRKKIGILVGAKEFLSAVGFVERTNFFEWSQSADDASLATKSRLDFALVALELLKNGTKPKEDDDKSLPLVESNEIAPEANELLPDAGLKVSADMEKCIELN